MFKGYDSKDHISIYELARILTRISRGQDCEKIARYLIESPPEDDEEYEYDNKVEKSVNEASEGLVRFVGDYTIPKDEEEQDLKRSIAKVSFFIHHRN